MAIVYNDRPKVVNNVGGKVNTVLGGYGNEIVKNVYLGSKEACGVDKLDELKKLNITGIVNCTKTIPNVHENSVTYCNIQVSDETSADIGIYFPGATEFINQQILNGGGVLVHCEEGISRSSTIVTSYLMRYHQMKRNEAYVKVKANRPVIDPNPGFYQQLKVFEYFLFSNEEDQTLSSFVKNNHYDDDNNNNVQKKKIDMKSWPQASSAKFGMLHASINNWNIFFNDILTFLSNDDDGDKSKNSNNIDFKLEEIFDTALDYVFGRGFNNYDILWLKSLYETLLSNGYNSTRNVILNKLSKDSEFLVNWEGEYRPRHMKILFDTLSLS